MSLYRNGCCNICCCSLCDRNYTIPNRKGEYLKFHVEALGFHVIKGVRSSFFNLFIADIQMITDIIDDLIKKLLKWKEDKQPQLLETSIAYLLGQAYVVLKNEPMLLELDAPINVLGDLHGQFGDLLHYFESHGYPPHKNYLFLGDYVDRGKNSVETLSLLLAFKVKFPLSIYLLRGNHESASINQYYGFYDECKRRFTIRLFKRFVDTYSYMPVAAIIRNRIFCCHGGLSPVLYEMNNIRNLKRPCEIKNSGLLCDLLWSDPDPEVTGWANNSRGCSFVFGTDVVDLFIKRFDLDLICRAHQVVEDGYEFFAKKQMITIFSAVNYCGEYDNAGAMMCVDAGLTITLALQKPKPYTDTQKPIIAQENK